MEKLIENLQSSIGEALPGVLGALVLLIIGWAIAIVIRMAIKKTLQLINLNDRVQKKGGKSDLDLELGIAKGAYYILLLIVVLAVFNQLGLEIVSQPIQALVSQFLDFIPNLISGAVLLIVAWLCGTIIKEILTGALSASGIDAKIKSQRKPLSQTLGEIAFWLIILIFLPGILGIFNLAGLMEPVQGMVDKILGMVPNILAAVIIIFVGWLIAKIFRDIVSNILSVAGADKLGEKIGLAENTKISGIVGLIVYIFVFVPAIIAGLNALKIDVIAKPATDMLNAFITTIPGIIAASAILLITYLIAKPVAGFVSTLCVSAGLDKFPAKIGIKGTSKRSTPSMFAGKVVFFFMMLFASMEAANRLNFSQFSEIVTTMIEFGGQVLLGSAIIAIGIWIANMVGNAIKKTSGGKNFMADLVRIVILGLVLAMGLRSMGIANDIVNMAFGITLGAAAVAFALSFGIGGREAAGKQMEYWLKKLRDEK